MPRHAALKLISVVLAVFLFVAILSVAHKIALVAAEKKILQRMQVANYCTRNDDCALVMYSCPFGCGVYINKKETAQISKMVSFYFTLRPLRCVYNCAMPVSPVCQRGKCVPKPCVLNKEYRTQFPDNCRCPPGSVAMSKVSPSGQRFFECGTRKK